MSHEVRRGQDTPKAKLDKGQKTFKETKGTKAAAQTVPLASHAQKGCAAKSVLLSADLSVSSLPDGRGPGSTTSRGAW